MTVSDKYLTIESDLVVNRIKELLTNADIGYNMKRIKAAGTKEIYRFTLDLGDHYNLAGDIVKPQFYHFNSYNGECANITTAGFLRMVCENGMMAGTSWFNQRIRHVKGQTAERKLKELEYQIAATIEYLHNGLPKKVERLADTKLSHIQMNRIVSELNIASCHKDKLEGQIFGWEKRREADSDNNLWTLWNLVNESLSGRARTEHGKINSEMGLIDQIETIYNKVA